MKCIIAYGISGMLEMCRDYIEKRFRIVGFSDTNTEKATILKPSERYISPENLKQTEFDYILITSVYDKEIKESLVNSFHIPEEKVLLLAEWQGMRFEQHFGERNPNKRFYVMSRFTRYRDGLFSHIFAYLEQLDWVEKNGVIPVVDMKNYQNQYLEENKLGIENAWEYYFEQISEYTLEEVYNSSNVILGYDKALYFDDLQQYDLERYSELWNRYIRLKPDCRDKIQALQDTLFQENERVLGVLYRGTDYNQLKLKNHAIQPEMQELFERIDLELEHRRYDKIYVSTESQNALEQIKKQYGSMVVHTNQIRFSDTGEKWLSEISFERENDRYLRGYEYLETIMILSHCTSLIAGVCCGSVCAKIMNDRKYKNEQLIEKGVY